MSVESVVVSAESGVVDKLFILSEVGNSFDEAVNTVTHIDFGPVTLVVGFVGSEVES